MEQVMIPARWLLWIVPTSAAIGFTFYSLCRMARDPEPKKNESHAQTRYDETAELVERLGRK